MTSRQHLSLTDRRRPDKQPSLRRGRQAGDHDTFDRRQIHGTGKALTVKGNFISAKSCHMHFRFSRQMIQCRANRRFLFPGCMCARHQRRRHTQKQHHFPEYLFHTIHTPFPEFHYIVWQPAPEYDGRTVFPDCRSGVYCSFFVLFIRISCSYICAII